MKNQPSEKNWQIYQYQSDIGYPIFIQFESEQFNENLAEIFNMLGLSLVDEKILQKYSTEDHYRLLSISEAPASVQAQMGIFREGDKYGKESISARDGYRVYRYLGHAIMVYSHFSNGWELGVKSHFGSASNTFSTKVILNRFLSLALAPLGLIGFWGVAIEGGIVVMGQEEAMADSVFLDINQMKFLSNEGARAIKGSFQLVRLDNTLRNRNKKMSKEELLSFLSLNTTYLGETGLSLPVRQVLTKVSKNFQGIIHPKENFKQTQCLSFR